MRPHPLCPADPATHAPVLSQPAKSPEATELCDLTNCALRVQRPAHQYCPDLRSRRRQLSYATSINVPCEPSDQRTSTLPTCDVAEGHGAVRPDRLCPAGAAMLKAPPPQRAG